MVRVCACGGGRGEVPAQTWAKVVRDPAFTATSLSSHLANRRTDIVSGFLTHFCFVSFLPESIIPRGWPNRCNCGRFSGIHFRYPKAVLTSGNVRVCGVSCAGVMSCVVYVMVEHNMSMNS